MKQKIIFFSICMFALLGFSQAQNIRLQFSSQLNCDWHVFDSVVITNLSQSNYSTTLYYPDTVLELSTGLGIHDVISNKNMEILTYPNPFSNTTEVSLHLFQAGNTTLTLYDLLGRIITQHNSYLDAGQHGFSLESCPNGYYLLHINTPQGSVSSKLLCFGSSGYATPSISYNSIQQQNEKSLKLYDPSFPFSIGDNLQIQTYLSAQDTSLSNTFNYTIHAIEDTNFMASFVLEAPYEIINAILIGKGSLYGNGQEGITKQNMVIKTSAAWNTLMQSMDLVNNVSNDFTETDIDFTQYQVIAIFDEIKNNDAWSIDITQIKEYADSIAVIYDNLETGDLTTVPTQPFYIVKIPISDKTMLFHDESGKVPFKPCPCEKGTGFETIHGEAYIFRDSIPQGIDYEAINAELPISGISLGISTIVFNSQTGEATLTPINKVPILANPVYLYICNFPDFAKEWIIPQNGLKVSIEGVLAMTCGGVTYGTYLNCILTNFKKK